jgi:Transposase domain (DUF772)/Transposase DDE domain
MPDEKLMRALEKNRYKRRNDYPIRAVWNSILASVVYQHNSIASLIRELRRNAQLRELCGFSTLKGIEAIPTRSAYSRFLVILSKHEHLIEEMFNQLVAKLSMILPNFGKNLAFDGKAIESLSSNFNKEKNDNDKRKENDADWGLKKYKGIDKNGNLWEKLKSWFGFKIHLIVDADYELPVAFSVNKASVSEQPEMHKLFDYLESKHPKILENCEHAMGDKGYDGSNLIKKLWDEYRIKPIIDIRNMKKDKEESWQFKTLDVSDITYNYKGEVFCHCPKDGSLKSMAFGGF